MLFFWNFHSVTKITYTENWKNWVSTIKFLWLYLYCIKTNNHASEAAVIIHNNIYSVNCVSIACSYKNITVLGSPQVFDERILIQFFYTLHSILVLGKEAKSLFCMKYSVYTIILVLSIRYVNNCSETACELQLIKVDLFLYYQKLIN